MFLKTNWLTISQFDQLFLSANLYETQEGNLIDVVSFVVLRPR